MHSEITDKKPGIETIDKLFIFKISFNAIIASRYANAMTGNPPYITIGRNTAIATIADIVLVFIFISFTAHQIYVVSTDKFSNSLLKIVHQNLATMF